jgi:hypothetical protein
MSEEPINPDLEGLMRALGEAINPREYAVAAGLVSELDEARAAAKRLARERGFLDRGEARRAAGLAE